MSIVGIIPARYGSSRFPGKPLINLLGKPMIQHVVEQCQKSQYLSHVVVATDDKRIFECVQAFGGHVVMTKTTHQSGTERCAEAVTLLNDDYDYVINIQGDEPLIHPNQIDDLAELLRKNQVSIATLARPIDDEAEAQSPNLVKVVINQKHEALYFSRSVIPFERRKRVAPLMQHVGIYGYQTDVLQEIIQLPNSGLEHCEALEQLRWLDFGYKIFVSIGHYPTYAIDSPEDVDLVLKQMQNG